MQVREGHLEDIYNEADHSLPHGTVHNSGGGCSSVVKRSQGFARADDDLSQLVQPPALKADAYRLHIIRNTVME